MYQLITHHDTFHIHKILGFSCLFNYFLRFYFKIYYGTTFMDYYTPLFHLLLSLSSFIFKVPKLRLNNKTIIWKELQLHNIIFTFRSVFMIYHSLLIFNSFLSYYTTRFIGIVLCHYFADYISDKYQINDKTTTRDIPYDNINPILIKINKKFYAISQIVATTTLLLTDNPDNGFIIMFPIQLSTFLMTLVRKNIITNNSWHLYYGLSLLLPYILNYNMMVKINNYKGYFAILHIILRLIFNFNKYLNFFIIYFFYNIFFN
jgi:hypothetical protein